MVIDNHTGQQVTIVHGYYPLAVSGDGGLIYVIFNCAHDYVSIHSDFGSLILQPLIKHYDEDGLDVIEVRQYEVGDMKCFGDLTAEKCDDNIVLRRK